jgi:glycine/D-amino acid oxidase-like deaminating enzyme
MGLVLDTAVVGGGIGGLAAAALAARRGMRVGVFERAKVLGGRGASQQRAGFTWNLGGHALYRGGPAERVLGALGVSYSGSPPPFAGYAVVGDEAHVLPTGPLTLLRTGALGLRGKLEAGKLLARLGSLDTAKLDQVTLSAWLDGEMKDARARAILEMFVRLTTYANAPDLVSAGASLAQLRLGQTKGVLYLDGGWQTLVLALTANVKAHDARIETGADVHSVEPRPGGFVLSGVDGLEVHARHVVLAVPPGVAAALVQGPARAVLEAWSKACVPARAACLDVVVSELPRPNARLALGVSEPTYFSVHSAVCKLGGDGRSALIHLMKYLSPEDDANGSEAELEACLDRMQPGWRDVLVERRFLPKLVTTNAIVTAKGGALAGRPGPLVPGCSGLAVVGDWVGAEGMLADASLGSAWVADAALAEEDSAPNVTLPRNCRGKPAPEVACESRPAHFVGETIEELAVDGLS